MDQPGVSVEQVSVFLRSCTPSQLIKCLAPILADRARAQESLEYRFALCEFFRCTDAALTSTAWECSLIAAAPADEDWSAFEGQDYWESGTCDDCNLEVSSYAKTAVCPLCAAAVHLT